MYYLYIIKVLKGYTKVLMQHTVAVAMTFDYETYSPLHMRFYFSYFYRNAAIFDAFFV